MGPIRVVGMEGLDEMEIDAINRMSNRYHEKIQREFNNVASLVIHPKKYRKEGRWWKYSIHVRAIAPTRIFVSTNGIDWVLEKALRSAFEDIIQQLHHSLHTDEQHGKASSRSSEGVIPPIEDFVL